MHTKIECLSHFFVLLDVKYFSSIILTWPLLLIVLTLFQVCVFYFGFTLFEVNIAEFVSEVDANRTEWNTKRCSLDKSFRCYIGIEKLIGIEWFYQCDAYTGLFKFFSETHTIDGKCGVVTLDSSDR